MSRKHVPLWAMGPVVWAVLLTVLPALGQGYILPEPWPPPPPPPPPMPRPQPHPMPPVPIPTREVPLVLKYLNVSAEITDGVAVTTVKQTFRNQTGRVIEGTYVFPLPDDAAVGSFNMTVGGQKMQGEVLDANAARRTYEDIVRRTRDPGLLEYLGSRMYRVKLFPIQPQAQLDVEMQYTQTLRETGGLVLFQHPLRGAITGDVPIEQLVLHAKLHSQVPLTTVFSPTHKCEIVRPNDHEATVTCEQSNARPDADFQLYYQRSDKLVGVSLLTYRGSGEPGYFFLRISPRIEISAEKIQPKDIAFVIDTSGSMRGDKIRQVREALKFCVGSLNERDRFNIYTFSTEVHPFRDALVPASGDLKSEAEEFAGKLEALGGTNINGALAAALQADPGDADRPYLIVFMTDGQPTVDVTDVDTILKNVTAQNARRVRFHVLGVGTDVNTHLLDKLAELNRGTREYASEKEDLELKISALASRLSNPVLTDLVLQIAGLKTSDLYPQTLPDLFRGGDVVVLGRYEGDGEHAIELKGKLLGDVQTIVSEGAFPEKSRENDFLLRLWAQRKVGYLLDQIRLHGANQELVDEVVRLAKRFGIVTPYTSALILEDDQRVAVRSPAPESVRMRDRVVRKAAEKEEATVAGGARGVILGPARAGGGAMGAAPAETGRAAVDASEALRGDMFLRGPASQPVVVNGQQVIRHVGDKTFVFDGERWVDTTWDGEKKPQKVTLFGDEYFALLAEHTELARYFGIGERVVVVFDGQAYETVPETPPDAQP